MAENKLMKIFIVGPAVIMVMKLIGARVTTIIGSVLIFLGILLSGFAPNVYVLYITFGFLAGKKCSLLNLK